LDVPPKQTLLGARRLRRFNVASRQVKLFQHWRSVVEAA